MIRWWSWVRLVWAWGCVSGGGRGDWRSCWSHKLDRDAAVADGPEENRTAAAGYGRFLARRWRFQLGKYVSLCLDWVSAMSSAGKDGSRWRCGHEMYVWAGPEYVNRCAVLGFDFGSCETPGVVLLSGLWLAVSANSNLHLSCHWQLCNWYMYCS